MKSLIMKEVRELTVWAAGVAMLLIGAMALILTQAHSVGVDYWSQSADVLFPNYCLWMMIGAMVTGAAIGLAQTLPERSRDQWAFLIHRPMSVTQIWGSKVIAGLSMYLACTLLPLIAVTAWMCAPGHFPGPFGFRLATPDLVYILVGVGFYFAGLFLGTSAHGIWVKFLAILVAVASLGLTVSCTSLWLAICPPLICLAPLAIASWGSFVLATAGRLTMLQKVFTGIVVAIGGAINVALVFVLVAAIWNTVAPRSNQSWRVPEMEQLAIGPQGNFVLVDQLQNAYNATSLIKVHSLNGTVLPDASLNASDYNMGQTIMTQNFNYNFANYYYWYQGLNFGQGHGWFFDPSSRLLLVFEASSYDFDGYVGRDGVLHDNPGEAQPFDSDVIMSTDNILACGNEIYWTGASSTLGQELTQLRTTSSGDPILAVSGESSPSGSDVYVLSRQSLDEFRPNGALWRSWPLALPESKWSMYRLFVSPDKPQIVLANEIGLGFDGASSYAPLANPVLETVGDVTTVNWKSSPYFQNPKFTDYWPAIFSPAAPTAVFLIGAGIEGKVSANSWANPPYWAKEAFYIFLWSLIGGVIAAGLIFPMALRYEVTGKRLALWMLGAVLLSWVMPVMMFAMALPPQQVICPFCGKKRSAESETCAHCGHALAQPASNGREIFEDENTDSDIMAFAS